MRFLIDVAVERAVHGGTSKIVLHAVDPHEHLAEAPAPMPERPHRLGPAATDLGRKDGAKPPPPEARRLVRDIDTALVRAKSSTFRSESG